MANNLSEQLKIQQEINSLLQKRSAMMKAQASQLTGQAKLAKQLCKALDCKDLDDMEDRLKGINDELKEAAKNAKATEDEIDEMGNAASRAEEKAGGLTGKLTAIGAAAGGIFSLSTVFKGFFGILKGGVTLLGSIVGGIFKIGKSILSIPFGIFQGLLGMAQSGGGGPSPIRLQLEEIRDSVGSLATNEGKALADTMRGAKQSFRELGLEGVSFGRVFGYGPGGVAEAGKAVMEIAGALGPQLGMLTNMTKKNQLAMAVYSKGLGLTAAQMRSVADLAAATGKNMNDYATEVASYAINMGKQFGVNAKLISKDMGAMMEDFGNFGRLGPKVMSSIAVYTRQLGFEAKELTGIIDKFDNFEDAAQSASKLNQVFGIQIDAMQQMKEQDPAKRLSNLQQAFAATGKSVENMSRQELKLLASTSGLSEKAAALAFSQKGLGMSYADVMAGAEESEGKQLSQAEAMKELSDSIKKTFGSGGGKQFKGFFDAFTQGFGRGIKRSREFRRVMRNIRRSLRVIYQAGKRVGKAFVDMFPGVKQTFKGLGDLFSPRKFRKLADGLVKAFKDMFRRVQTDPRGGVRVFFQDIQKLFGDFFSSQSPAIKMIKEGAAKFTRTLSLMFAEGIKLLKPKIIDGLNAITEFIKDPSGFMDAAATAGSFLSEIFGPIIEAITEGEGPDSGVTGAFNNLFTTLWDKIGPNIMASIKEFGEKFLERALIFIAVKAIMGAMMGAMIGGIGKLFQKLTATAPTPAQNITIVRKGFVEQLTELAELDQGKVTAAIKNLGLLAGGFAIAILAFGAAFAGVMAMLDKYEATKILAVGAVIYGMGKVMASLAQSAAMMAEPHTTFGEGGSQPQPKHFAKAAAMLAVAGAFTVGLALAGALVAQEFESVRIGDAATMVLVIGGLGLITMAVAAAAGALSMIKVDPASMGMAALTVTASAAVVLALGYFGAKTVKAFEGVNKETAVVATDVIKALVPMVLATAGGALLIGAIILKSAGLGLLAIAAGLAALGTVGLAITEFTKDFIKSVSGISKANAEKAAIIADVATTVTYTAAKGLGHALELGFGALLSSIVGFFTGNPVEEGIEAMSDFMGILSIHLPKIMDGMMKAVAGRSTEEVENAMNLLKQVMNAILPMIDVQKASMNMVVAMKTLGGMNNDEITKMFDTINEFATAPLQKLTKMVELLKDASEKLGQNQAALQGAQAMGSLLSAASSFLGAMMKPVSELIKNSTRGVSRMTEDGTFTDSYQITQEFDPSKFNRAMRAMETTIPRIMTGMAGAIEQFVQKISRVSFTESQVANINQFSNLVGPLAGGIGALVTAFTKVLNMNRQLLPAIGRVTGGGVSQKFVDELYSLVESLSVMLFGGNLEMVDRNSVYTTSSGKAGMGLIPLAKKIVDKFANMPMPEKSKMDNVVAMMTSVKTVTDMVTNMLKGMRGVGGTIPEDAKTSTQKRGEFFKKINEFVCSIMETMKTGMGAFMKTMIERVDELIPANANLATINRTKKRIETASLLFKSLQPIVDMVSSMMAVFKSDSPTVTSPGAQREASDAAAKAPNFGEFAANAKTFIECLIEGLTGNKGIEAIVDMFTKKGGLIDKVGPRTHKLRTRLKNLKDIMEVMGSVGKLIKDLAPLMGASGNTAGAFGDMIEVESGGVVDGTRDGTGTAQAFDTRLTSKIENTLRMMPTMFGQDGKYLIDAITLFQKVMPHVKNLPAISDSDKKIASVGDVADLFNNETIKGILAGTISLTVPGDMGTITKQFDVLKTFISKTSEAAYRIKGKTIGSDGIANEITNAKLAIVAMGELMTVAGAPTTVRSAFSNGKLIVQHQMPQGVQASVNVHVNINGSSLAKALTQPASAFTQGNQKVVLDTRPKAG